jgi:hypothetical protein
MEARMNNAILMQRVDADGALTASQSDASGGTDHG